MRRLDAPIITEAGLVQIIIEQIHFDCYQLCKQALGFYAQNSGNMGVFCHSDSEYKELTNIRERITEPSNNPDQKYFRLKQPIIFPATGDVPKTAYTHLYIRKPDPTPYGKYTGDVDFYLEPEEYLKLKTRLLNGEKIKGAQIYDRPGWDMIQLFDPEIAAVAYVSVAEMTQKVHVKM